MQNPGSIAIPFSMVVRGAKWFRLVFSVAVVVILMLLITRMGKISYRDVAQALKNFSPLAVLIAYSCCVLQIFFQIARFWVLLPKKAAVAWSQAATAISMGQFLNAFAPARAGDVAKAAIISRKNSGDVPFITGAGVIVSDRIVDLVSLFIILVFSGAYRVPAFALSNYLPSGKTVTIAVLVSLAIIGFLVVAYKKQWLVMRWVSLFKEGLRSLGHPASFLISLLVSVGAWGSEAFAIKMLCNSQGLPLSFADAVYVLTVLNLAIAIPIAVANVGVFEASVVFALSALDTPIAQAIAIGTVHHGLQFASVGTWALFMALFPKNKPTASVQPKDFRVEDHDKKKAIEYFEKVSQQYDETVSKGLLKMFRDKERNAVLELAALDQPGKWLLDVGCGAGLYSLEAKKAQMRVHAVDASAGMVKRLEGLVDEAGVADIETFEPVRLYDRVICAGVLDFVLHPELAFMNLCRSVAPGGRLVVLCPRKGPGGLFYRIEKFFFGIKINLFRRDWLANLAGQNGLKLTQYSHPLPTNMALLFERV
ncbi:MAG: flippase-like domain-containing protein [Deltaproteobacteria bacterium]|nr:flippase-like domain-containing protein [Deltaproteobacteria bacterium]